jgi:hypothetical protein
MRNGIIIMIYLIVTIVFNACNKPAGTGGKVQLNIEAKHHTTPIPGCRIFIKYGAQEFPGSNTANYDASITLDNNGKGSFTGLRKGDYYLYGVGFDPGLLENVTGGIPVKIEVKAGDISVVVPVTEDHTQ